MKCRSPDPTLVKHSGLVALTSREGTARVGHRITVQPDNVVVTGCGLPEPAVRVFLDGDEAAYIAVPCHVCFPAADGRTPACC